MLQVQHKPRWAQHQLLANFGLTGTINMPGQGVQHYCARAEKIAPTEAYTLLPYSVLPGTRTPQCLCQYIFHLSPFKTLRNRRFVLH